MRQLFVFWLFLLLSCCGDKAVETYDITRLASLKTFGGAIPDQVFSEYLVVFYFQGIDCDYCIKRELKYIGDFLKEGQDHLSGIVVTHYDEHSGHIALMLRDFQRIGKLAIPVLVEETLGQAGLGTQIRVALIDLENGSVVTSYHPEFSRDQWPEFERDVLQRIATLK